MKYALPRLTVDGVSMRRLNSVGVGFLAAALTACGGGGGGDGIPKECTAYCDLACGKIGTCENTAGGFAQTCSRACVDTLKEHQTATASDCTNAGQFVLTATCAQLEQFIGLRSEPTAGNKLATDLPAQIGEQLATTGLVEQEP
jgi:hypothetical protein